MESAIATYFSKLYYSKDTTNKNKFKFGKMFYENDDLIVIIFGKPRGNYFNRHFGSYKLFNHYDCDNNPNIEKVISIKENVSCGGFRIKWNVTKNTYQYVCSTTTMPCGCGGGSPELYFSIEHVIDLDKQYVDLKNNLLNNKVIESDTRKNSDKDISHIYIYPVIG